MDRTRFTACLALLAMLAAAPEGGAQAAKPDDWAALIGRYAADPVGTRDEVLLRARDGVDGQGIDVLLVVADANFRRGKLSDAERYFEKMVDESPKTPPGSLLVSYARLGLGMIAVRKGDLPAARAAFATASEISSGGLDRARWLANVAEAQTAAAMGDTDEAIMMLEDLEQAAPDESAPPGVIEAVQFARGSALMEAGEFAEAAAVFDAIAASGGEGADDARYAAARARLGAGEIDAARNALAELVAACPRDAGPSERASSRIRDLEPYGILRKWIDNYRDLPFGAFEKRGTLYALGGCDLARTTLARIEADGGWRPPPREALPVAAEDEPEADEPEAADDTKAAPPLPTETDEPDSPWPVVGALGALGAAVLLAFAWLRRRR